MPNQFLEDVPEVKTDFSAEGGYTKFIVATVTDSNGNEKIVIRCTGKYESHINILQELQAEVGPVGLSASCIGGGWYILNEERKTLLLYGDSGQFNRELDRERTVLMIQGALPEFIVTGRR